ncbi:MAG TPA: hypothetical protein VFJ04_08655 [Rhodanobacteraceae bacterium]|jgi:hypothetical protein|nr:hypothetical protein [Rhodanobacteraceae bacterium]
MTMEAPAVLAGSDIFERILGADGPLVVLETDQAEMLIEQFRQLARRNGQTAYLWREGAGLASLREGEVRVPGCLRMGDTLRYVLQSMHFGVYLFADVGVPISSANLSLLRQLTRSRSTHVRRVVLLTASPQLADSLGGIALALRRREARVQPRLRDGRWVT